MPNVERLYGLNAPYGAPRSLTSRSDPQHSAVWYVLMHLMALRAL